MIETNKKSEAQFITMTKFGLRTRAADNSCEKTDAFHVCLPVIQAHFSCFAIKAFKKNKTDGG